MDVSFSQYTPFWLELLTYANAGSDEQRIRRWNGYLADQLHQDFKFQIRNLGNTPFNQFDVGSPSQLLDEEKSEIDALAENHGGHPPLSDIALNSHTRCMDFSEQEFTDDISFNELFLINASFNKTKFQTRAHFYQTTFIGTAEFNQTHFMKRCRFDHASFENTAYFKKTTFHEFAVFDNVRFSISAYFNAARFLPLEAPGTEEFGGVGFRNTTFTGEAIFTDVHWDIPVDFKKAHFENNVSYHSSVFEDRAIFERTQLTQTADFTSVNFKQQANFNNASFGSTTCFNRARFSQPPMFFETKLHENTNFSDIEWQHSESYYKRLWWTHIRIQGRQKNKSADKHIIDAMHAWDRLALIMSKLEKFPERHEFYRLRLRAQRMRDGLGILSGMNWLFETLCDYGWSIKGALGWWAAHFFFLGLLIFCQTNPRENTVWPVLYDCILVSFANAHAFLGLTLKNGYLYEKRQSLIDLISNNSMFQTIGFFQAIIGPVLLFLLLLTMRNRFRL